MPGKPKTAVCFHQLYPHQPQLPEKKIHYVSQGWETFFLAREKIGLRMIVLTKEIEVGGVVLQNSWL